MRLIISLSLFVTAFAATAQPSVEDTIEYRQSVYRVIGWNFKVLRAMAKGDLAHDAGDFHLRAQRIAQMVDMLDEAYREVSLSPDSAATAAIWERREEFDRLLARFDRESDELAVIAATGDKDQTLAQFVEMAGVCKDCHDEFKD